MGANWPIPVRLLGASCCWRSAPLIGGCRLLARGLSGPPPVPTESSAGRGAGRSSLEWCRSSESARRPPAAAWALGRNHRPAQLPRLSLDPRQHSQPDAVHAVDCHLARLTIGADLEGDRRQDVRPLGRSDGNKYVAVEMLERQSGHQPRPEPERAPSFSSTAASPTYGFEYRPT